MYFIHMYVFVSTDINECTIYQCHQCTNTNGSYSCSCNAGYTLVNNSLCEGTIRLELFNLSFCYTFL